MTAPQLSNSPAQEAGLERKKKCNIFYSAKDSASRKLIAIEAILQWIGGDDTAIEAHMHDHYMQAYARYIVALEQGLEPKKVQDAKASIPAITLSASFTKGRKLEHIAGVTGLIAIDIDPKDKTNPASPDSLQVVRAALVDMPCTRAVWSSVSGKGLVWLVEYASDTPITCSL